MNKIYNPEKSSWPDILKRPTPTVEDIESIVLDVFNDVKILGNEGVKKYTEKFDGVSLSNFEVSKDEIERANGLVSSDLQKAIKLAKRNIEKFHAAQRTDMVVTETTQGVTCWQEKRAIDKVGLYIPGGTAPLFSTILMLAVPANIAGCKEIVLCTPPDKQGKVNPVILYTAALCGVSKIFKVGGIQAIAAMTFGTDHT